MSRPTVTVAMCTYNSSRYIDETLRSVFAQTWQDFEVVVVDDGSTDGTVELIAERYRDPRLSILRQPHQTLRAARPLVVAQAVGEFIAFLDHDDVWMPDKLERQLAAARAAPDAALVFSDCLLISGTGEVVGRLSDRYDFASIGLTTPLGHLELLRRGCFVAYSTAFVRAAAVRGVGGFNHTYSYVSDYDSWLRLARRHPMRVIQSPLAKYRIHGAQFTQRQPDVILVEHRALLEPILWSASYPPDVRIAVGDNLLGQHRMAARTLIRHRRIREAIQAGVAMSRYPDRIRDSWRHRASRTPFGPVVESTVVGYHWAADCIARIAAVSGYVAMRGRRAPRRLGRVLRGREPLVRPTPIAGTAALDPTSEIWVDGTSLGREQTGYFNLLSELVRQWIQREQRPYGVHIIATRSGRAALIARLGSDAARLRFHAAGWRALHWSDIHDLLFGMPAALLVAVAATLILLLGIPTGNALGIGVGLALLIGDAAVLLDGLGARFAAGSGRHRLRLSERLVRFAWRRLPRPMSRTRAAVVEVLFWRGRFRWRNSHRIAIVQDMTTRIHPELHTPQNVVEFDEFLGYVQRHAHAIVTVSEQSRRDIVDRIAVCPDQVQVVPMPVHPQYRNPPFSRAYVAAHGITTRYVLCVGAVEPRKNLRRLVKAFELIKDEDATHDVLLVLAGPPGWDSGFGQFLVQSDVYPRVRMPGFVPLGHLPSLYHFASAVICPSVYEGFGLPVLEAMCCSSIVIASNVSSLPEVLGAGGMLFNPYDTQEIAATLLRALTLSPPEAAAYRLHCRERAEQHLGRLACEDAWPDLAAQGTAGA